MTLLDDPRSRRFVLPLAVGVLHSARRSACGEALWCSRGRYAVAIHVSG